MYMFCVTIYVEQKYNGHPAVPCHVSRILRRAIPSWSPD